MTTIYFNQIDLSTNPKEVDKDAPFIKIAGGIDDAIDIGEQLLYQNIVDSYIVLEYFKEGEVIFV